MIPDVPTPPRRDATGGSREAGAPRSRGRRAGGTPVAREDAASGRALRRALGLLFVAAVAGCAVHLGPRSEPLPAAELVGFRHDAGEVLLGRAGCVACHDADAATRARLATPPAPDLSRVGARRTAAWLEDFLARPHRGAAAAANPDVDDATCPLMPDLLAPLPTRVREEASEELVAFLGSLGGPYEPTPEPPVAWPIAEGAALFTRTGCHACHASGLDGDALAERWERATLRDHLADPLATHPAGRMPDLALTTVEADALAAWLLRDAHAAGPTEVRRGPGLRSDLYVFDEGIPVVPDLTGLEPARTTIVPVVGHEEGDVVDRYVVRLTGELLVPETGGHVLATESDDGSLLRVDGALVVDNDGNHSRSRKDASVTLDAGWHALEIVMFENAGDAWLDAGWVRDGELVPFAPEELRVTQHVYAPDGWEPTTVDEALVARGRRRFSRLGCVNCHAVDGVDAAPRAPDLDALRYLEDGCLADNVLPGRPDHHLDDAQRAALRTTLRGAAALAQPLPPEVEVERALARLDCLACHARDGAGGPRGAARAAFGGEADLGDEGRLPPDLSGIGAKLRPRALHDVLAGDVRARPYLHARMPSFGEAALGGLAEALVAADRGAARAADRDALAPRAAALTEAELLDTGRRLVGTGGFSCITCHTVAGQPSLGLPGLDLATVHDRVERDWFRRWMREPLALRPGTRMPTFFDEGRSVLADELGGDADAQIDAVWAYLALGGTMPLPPGVVVDPAAYRVVAADRPAYVGVFMEGLSARTLCVGFPENVHVAWDGDHVRLARAWRGAFLDAEGTWRERAGQLESPAGEDVLDLPAGPAFAWVDPSTDARWPASTPRAVAGTVRVGEGTRVWRTLGHVRDADGRPTFRSVVVGADGTTPELVVEESPVPRLDREDARLVRRFALRVPAGVPLPAHRAWTAAGITRVEGGVHGDVGSRGDGGTGGDGTDVGSSDDGETRWRDGAGVELVVRGAHARVRATPDGDELLVTPAAVGDADGPRTATFEVELRW